MSSLEFALVRKVLSLLHHLSDLLGTEASALLSLLLLLHLLGFPECFLHSLTLALLVDELELLAAQLEAALFLTPVVFFIQTLALREIPLALIQSLTLELSAALLLRECAFLLDGGGDDGAVGGSKGYKGCESKC